MPSYPARITLAYSARRHHRLAYCSHKVNILKYINTTSNESADNLLHSFSVLCENENFLISSLHYFFVKATPYLLVRLSSLIEQNIFLSISSYPFNILNTSI